MDEINHQVYRSGHVTCIYLLQLIYTVYVMHQLMHDMVLIIPITVCYYLELRNAIMSSSRVQFLKTKVQ